MTILQQLFRKKNRKATNQPSLIPLIVLFSLLLSFSTLSYSASLWTYYGQGTLGGSYVTIKAGCATEVANYCASFSVDVCYAETGPAFTTEVNPPQGSCYYYDWAAQVRAFTQWSNVAGPCPSGYKDDGTGQCVEITLEQDHKQSQDICTGNPIIVATGNKFQTETDYQSQKPFGLNFVRYYNSSSNAVDKGMGKKWQHGFNRAIKLVGLQAQVARSNGQTFLFNFDGSDWVGDVDISETLVETVDGNSVRTGWVYTDSRDNVETFNATGQLLSITNRAGQSQIFSYDITAVEGGDDNLDTLDKVTGFGGETLAFVYDSEQRITNMTDPEGNQYTYDYDAAGNLTSVTYPDNTPLDTTDNPARTYHYESTTFPSHLTGLTDETGSRVTWDFDEEGRAISSELDGGVDKSTLDFSVTDQVTVTNPLGKDTTYHFTTLHGVKKVTQVEGHATASCAGANQNYTYDANGYLASKTDWQDNTTTYVHDARGLETSRTEASGTPRARTITTEWHNDFRLPTKTIAPGQVTDFVYDTQGRLTSQTTHDVQ